MPRARPLALAAVCLLASASALLAAPLELRYTAPAARWTEALPVGNGRLGAMVFGDPAAEHLQVNEATLWSGHPRDWDNPGAQAVLPQVRAALRAGDYVAAEELCHRMQGPYNESYQPLGDIRLAFAGTGAVTDYERSLDLETAVAHVSFRQNGVTFHREVWSSYPDQVIVVRLSADRPGSINLDLTADSLLRATCEAQGGDGLLLRGRAPDHVDPSYLRSADPVRYDDVHPQSMRFALRVVVRHRGGTIGLTDAPLTSASGRRAPPTRNRLSNSAQREVERIDPMRSSEPHAAESPPGGSLRPSNSAQRAVERIVPMRLPEPPVADAPPRNSVRVEAADEVVLLLSAATSFNGPDRQPATEGQDELAAAAAPLAAAQARTSDDLLRRAEADFQRLFGRVRLDLGSNPAAEFLPTDERLARSAAGQPDPGLSTLLYQYGRYLLISSSRPGGLPANLQGLWNDLPRPPWSANWTLNINAEMNYWPAEVANLSECAEPWFDFIEGLARHGAVTARVNYGARGWVAHHNADIWEQTGPVGDYGGGDPVWANWAMSGPWMCRQLWEHYEYTADRNFLARRAWPAMAGSAEFCLDWLIDDGHGRLVTAPSGSPELKFVLPDGRKSGTGIASTMDLSLVRDLFDHVLAAEAILQNDAPLAARVRAARDRLLPLQIGSRGQLQEWSVDFPEEDVHHRHSSHLFAVFPGQEITPERPALFAAARRSLELRGDDGTGWSLGWKINLWARFRDGDHAYRLVRNLLRPVGNTTHTSYGPGGGVYPNLFDAHPPFQIDGNFAFTSGVSEMLLQSQSGELDLLPALPSVWPTGSVSGLRARGDFLIENLTWQDGRLVSVRVRANRAGPCTLRSGTRRLHRLLAAGETLSWDGAQQ